MSRLTLFTQVSESSRISIALYSIETHAVQMRCYSRPCFGTLTMMHCCHTKVVCQAYETHRRTDYFIQIIFVERLMSIASDLTIAKVHVSTSTIWDIFPSVGSCHLLHICCDGVGKTSIIEFGRAHDMIPY